MPLFTIEVPQVATGAAANTFTTLLGLKMADTLGHRLRLRKLTVAGGGGAAQDLQVAIRLMKTNNTTDGTSTAVNVNTIGKKDPLSVASNVAAIGKTYTNEPTAKGTDTHGVGGLNTRGVLHREWEPDEAPQCDRNQTLCIEGAPGSANAANLTVAAEWEEY